MPSPFQLAIQKFDQANSLDPHQETFEDKQYPKELLYALRMSAILERFEPKASEVLKLAARSQHLCRWTIPRKDYPMDRAGYLKWRTALKDFHAVKAGEILKESGYSSEITDRVQKLLRKEGLKSDPDMQRLEDVICLVFLQYYFEAFSKEHDEAKIISIVQKTWKKMSARGQSEALTLELSDSSLKLIKKALSL